MLSFGKDTHVVAIWYVPGDESDFLASLTRESDGSHLVRYRFRYYKDDTAFDSDDEKSWWSAAWPPGMPVAQAEEAVDMAAAKASKDQGGKPIHKMEINGDGEKALRIISEQPFVHVRKA